MKALLARTSTCGCITRKHVQSCRRRHRLCSSQQREVGCSDLYNMTEAINAQRQLEPTPEDATLSRTGVAAQEPSKDGKALQAGASLDSTSTAAASTNNSVGYYAGLVTTDLKIDNNASGADMLKRNLQLAGGVAGVLALLTYLFLASNNLV